MFKNLEFRVEHCYYQMNAQGPTIFVLSLKEYLISPQNENLNLLVRIKFLNLFLYSS